MTDTGSHRRARRRARRAGRGRARRRRSTSSSTARTRTATRRRDEPDLDEETGEARQPSGGLAVLRKGVQGHARDPRGHRREPPVRGRGRRRQAAHPGGDPAGARQGRARAPTGSTARSWPGPAPAAAVGVDRAHGALPHHVPAPRAAPPRARSTRSGCACSSTSTGSASPSRTRPSAASSSRASRATSRRSPAS